MANQSAGKAASDSPALKPYRGKPAVRNFRGGNGNVGIIRSPVRATILLDCFPLLVTMQTDGAFIRYDLSGKRRYAPDLLVPASFWVLRRELAEDIAVSKK
jgi:hypothetical protein